MKRRERGEDRVSRAFGSSDDKQSEVNDEHKIAFYIFHLFCHLPLRLPSPTTAVLFHANAGRVVTGNDTVCAGRVLLLRETGGSCWYAFIYAKRAMQKRPLSLFELPRSSLSLVVSCRCVKKHIEPEGTHALAGARPYSERSQQSERPSCRKNMMGKACNQSSSPVRKCIAQQAATSSLSPF